METLGLPEGPGVNNDVGIEQGTVVPFAYDPMLGKLIAHGRDRPATRGAAEGRSGSRDDARIIPRRARGSPAEQDRSRCRGGEEKEEEVRALMPGRVLEVCVTPSDSVETGGLLLVTEADEDAERVRARARAPWSAWTSLPVSLSRPESPS